MNIPLSVYKRLPKRVPHSLGFKRYAMSFDGVDDYGQIPRSDSLAQHVVTVEILVRLRDLETGYATIVGFGGGAGGGFPNGDWSIFGGPSAKALAFQPDGDANRYKSANIYLPELNKWYHATLTWDNVSTARWYLNGKLAIERTDFSPIQLRQVVDFYIGNRQPVDIALVRIYNRVLTEREIRYNMLNYHNPIRDGLVLWLHDRIVGDTWYDESGNNNHGIIYGGAVKKPIRMWELRSEVGL